jgi:TPR repeat protein
MDAAGALRSTERLNELQGLKEKARLKKRELNDWKASFKVDAGRSPTKAQKRTQRLLIVEYNEAKKAYESLKQMLQEAKWTPPVRIGEPLPDTGARSTTDGRLSFQGEEDGETAKPVQVGGAASSESALEFSFDGPELEAEELYHRGMDFFTGGEDCGVTQDHAQAFRCLLAAAELADVDAQCMVGFMYGHGYGTPLDEEAAVRWTRESAEKGNPEAQFNLATMYTNSTGVERNDDEARRWLELAASQGFEEAVSALNDRTAAQHQHQPQQHHHHHHQHINPVEVQPASDALAAAGSLGQVSNEKKFVAHAESPLTVGSDANKRERPSSSSSSFQERRAAAAQGDADEQYNVGLIYMQGMEGVVAKSCEKAFEFFLLSAEQGTVEAQCILGFIYGHGHGVATNKEEAFRWTARAAEQGSKEAQFNLGLFYHTGDGTAKDEEKAQHWFQKAAAQGFEEARLNLSTNSTPKEAEEGEGVSQQLGEVPLPVRKSNAAWEAAKVAKLNAERGDPEAQYNLALLYLAGSEAVKQDPEAAYNWLLKAATQNNANACCLIGFMYGQGGVGGRNSGGGQGTSSVVAPGSSGESQAAHWTRKAAEQGHTEAQFNLGVMCAAGKGVAKNDKEAVLWFQRAAAKGFVEAQVNLSAMVEQGRSTPSRSLAGSTNHHQQRASASAAPTRSSLPSTREELLFDGDEVKAGGTHGDEAAATVSTPAGALIHGGTGGIKDSESALFRRSKSPLSVASSPLNSEVVLGHHWAYHRVQLMSCNWEETGESEPATAARVEVSVFLLRRHPSHAGRAVVGLGSCCLYGNTPPTFGYPGCSTGGMWPNYAAFVRNNHPLISCLGAHDCHPLGRRERICLWACALAFNAFLTAVLWAFVFQHGFPVVAAYVLKFVSLVVYARCLFEASVFLNYRGVPRKPQLLFSTGSEALDAMAACHALLFVLACFVATSSSLSSRSSLDLASLFLGFGVSEGTRGGGVVVGVLASQLLHEIAWLVLTLPMFLALFASDREAWHHHEARRTLGATGATPVPGDIKDPVRPRQCVGDANSTRIHPESQDGSLSKKTSSL